MSSDTKRPRTVGEHRSPGPDRIGVRVVRTLQDTQVDMPPVPSVPPIPSGVMHWHGRATGSWWAVVPGRHGARLIEAPSRDALARMLWGRP